MKKKALLIGVNEYQNFNDLRGCINDVKSMRKILMNYLKFKPEDIRVIVNDRATKESILHRINWLIEKSKPEDYLVLYFAGHGSQIRDRDGDELKDHLDEIICPHDMDWDGTFIVDDDLHSKFKGLEEGVLLEVMLDCCHSGTGTRELAVVSPNSGESNILFRYLDPPVDILCRSDVYEELPSLGFGPKSKLAKLNHVVWSACKDNQGAADDYIGGQFHGVFTHYVCTHFEATQGMVSRIGLLRRIRASIRHGGYSQIPQLAVPAGFGIRESYTQGD